MILYKQYAPQIVLKLMAISENELIIIVGDTSPSSIWKILPLSINGMG